MCAAELKFRSGMVKWQDVLPAFGAVTCLALEFRLMRIAVACAAALGCEVILVCGLGGTGGRDWLVTA